MSDLITWLIVLVIAAGALWVLANDYQQKQSRSVRQYEDDVRAGRTLGSSLSSAGLLEIEKLTKPNLQAAIEFLQDEKGGQTESKENNDDDEKQKKDSEDNHEDHEDHEV